MGIMLLMRALPADFIAPCLPTKIDKLPSGDLWLHEIKHDDGAAGARCAKQEGPMSNKTSMHHDLWAGIALKLGIASYHFGGMERALQPPEQTAYTVALESSGTIIGGNWHTAFYAHVDAFLSAARSVPELIRCCFGVDDGSQKMRDWFNSLDPDEQKRRREFGDRFRAEYDAFRALPLGTARHISEHRTGFAPVEVMVFGHFGIYAGGPIDPIPTTETRDLPPESNMPPGIARPIPVRPSWQDFKIDGKPLFETCRDYLNQAQALISQARAIADKVHGNCKLTWPPTDL